MQVVSLSSCYQEKQVTRHCRIIPTQGTRNRDPETGSYKIRYKIDLRWHCEVLCLEPDANESYSPAKHQRESKVILDFGTRVDASLAREILTAKGTHWNPKGET